MIQVLGSSEALDWHVITVYLHVEVPPATQVNIFLQVLSLNWCFYQIVLKELTQVI